MKNTDPGKMTSDIARTACRNYKEDPKAVDDVKDWIIYNYGKQMKEELAEKEKALRIELEKEREEALRKQKLQIARNLLSSSSMTISEIANATDLDESEIKKISKEP